MYAEINFFNVNLIKSNTTKYLPNTDFFDKSIESRLGLQMKDLK